MKTTPRAAAPDSRKEGTMNDKLTILYERLSHEDGRENESLSIEHQENICQGGFHPKVKSPKNWKLVKL